MKAASLARFLGDSFLADFTLVICTEPPAPHASSDTSRRDQGAAPETSSRLRSRAAAAAPDLLPGTPDNSRSPRSTAAGGVVDAQLSAAVALSRAETGDSGPCSGQHHPPDAPAELSQLSSSAADAVAGDTATAAAAKAALAHNNRGASSDVGTGSSVGVSAAAAAAAAAADGGGGGDSNAIAMPVHGVVLAAASPYFETLMRDWASPTRVLHMVVGEDQLPAAQALLAFLYTAALPAALPQADLLQLLLLADRFDVAAAVAAARRALAAFSPAALEWATLVGLWSLPGHLFEGQPGDDAAVALRRVAWDRLLLLFGDLEEAWTGADGRRMWQQLPLRAISALVASDSLAVSSENTVIAAVSSWIAHQHHHLQQQQQLSALDGQQQQQLSDVELQLLAASIRLPALGPAYLSNVAMQHDWFAAAVDVASLARAAAFAAAGPEVRKDITNHTAAAAAAAAQAAAAVAATPGRHSCCSCSGEGGGSGPATAAAAAVDASGSSCLGGWGPSGLGPARCSSCGGRRHSATGSAAAPAAASASAAASGAAAPSSTSSSTSSAGGCGSYGTGGCSSSSSAVELRAQLASLAQAMQRPRAVSCRRLCQFAWRVDVASIHSLWRDVAAAGSRDSRILRSPAHSFAGYEWALQLEVTQTRGATGFDGSKPWSLGVFLTCQVRLEQPASSNAEPTSAGQAASDSRSSSVSSDAKVAAGQLAMQLVDFGFVSTSATIAMREAGGSKRCEKSWEHAVVRFRASWGWPNFMDVQCVGWDEAIFERWLIDGQLHLNATVRVLG